MGTFKTAGFVRGFIDRIVTEFTQRGLRHRKVSTKDWIRFVQHRESAVRQILPAKSCKLLCSLEYTDCCIHVLGGLLEEAP